MVDLHDLYMYNSIIMVCGWEWLISACAEMEGGRSTLVSSAVFLLLFSSLATCAPTLQRTGYSSQLLLYGRPADLECEACKIIVAALQDLLEKNSSEEEIVKVITTICIDLKIEDENVCTLVVPEFKVQAWPLVCDVVYVHWYL